MKIVAGNSNATLAQAIAGYLSFDLAACAVKRFADQKSSLKSRRMSAARTSSSSSRRAIRSTTTSWSS
jgi:phosphoribosylpyrophosphate synthetase